MQFLSNWTVKSPYRFQVEKVRVTKHKGKAAATGLMTIKATVEKQRYKIVQVIDAVTEKSYTLVQARRRGLIDLKTNEYVYPETKERIPLDDAIDEGLVIVEFEETVVNNNEASDDELETRTYAIKYVLDQKRQTKVPFHQAVKRGLIDAETGNYYNNVTGEQVYLVDAIKKGLLKGGAVGNAESLDIDVRNKMVVETIGKIKKYVLNPLSVITAFRRAAKEV